MNDLVSVIIPTYQRPEMLRQAIWSIKAQDYPNLELIVVDDHSGDNTSLISQEFSDVIYYENSRNQGPGFSRKFGLSVSHGKYIVFIDDDDFYISDSFFSNAVEKFHANNQYAFVAASAKSMDQATGKLEESPLNIQGEMDAIEYLSGFSFRYDVPLTFATMFSRKHLETCGVFEMQMVNHMPMIMRCLQSGKVFFLSDYVGVYRKHSSNISNAISADFLIDNLKEKYEIYLLIKSKQLFEDYNAWWLEQLKTTVGYFVYGSHPSLNELKKVRKWCLLNAEDKESVEKLFDQYCAYLIDNMICAVKRKIKKVLGIK